MQRLPRIVTALLALSLSFPRVADASTSSSNGPGSSHSAKAEKRKRSKHREPVITGFHVPASKIRTEPLPRPSGHLELINANSPDEQLTIELYNADGTYNEDSIEKLYHFWRCRRTGTERPIDNHLFELLSHIYDHFQSPIELVSGFRNQEHMTSYHFHGSASDIRVRGVKPDEVHAFAQTLDEGGMGLGRYPLAKFVHIDVRPESYRWVDRSPPGSSHPTKKSKRHRNT